MELCITAPENHVSGAARMEEYVRQRIHQEINKTWHRIVVTGRIRRHPPAIINNWEKKQRPFDSWRPTVTPDGSTLWVNCMPSRSLIQHTASVIATFLRLEGKNPDIVETDLSEDDSYLLRTLQHESNLVNIEQTDLVIIGQVHKLRRLPPGKWWETDRSQDDDLFRWHTFLSPKGKKVTLLGCREGLWGESAAAIAKVLHDKAGTSCILYVGKVGALDAEYAPNEWIATGQEATVGEQVISWNGLFQFQGMSEKWPTLALGTQVTVASPLCETKSWLDQYSMRYNWVDCETGHLAKVAKEVGMQFGYLHLVSDNLKGGYDEDLSNEENILVDQKREALYQDIEGIIEAFLASWDGTQDI